MQSKTGHRQRLGKIPLQMVHKYSGIFTRTIDAAGYWIKQLFNERNYACVPGARGGEHTKSHFLIMREIKDYQFAFLSLLAKDDIVRLRAKRMVGHE
jgi:trehalose synthase